MIFKFCCRCFFVRTFTVPPWILVVCKHGFGESYICVKLICLIALGYGSCGATVFVGKGRIWKGGWVLKYKPMVLSCKIAALRNLFDRSLAALARDNYSGCGGTQLREFCSILPFISIIISCVSSGYSRVWIFTKAGRSGCTEMKLPCTVHGSYFCAAVSACNLRPFLQPGRLCSDKCWHTDNTPVLLL